MKNKIRRFFLDTFLMTRCSFIVIFLFCIISTITSCSDNKKRKGSRHFNQYVIEVFAWNQQKEPIEGFLSVKVQTKQGIDISIKETEASLLSREEQNWGTTTSQKNDFFTSLPLSSNKNQNRYFLVFPARIKRQDIKNITFKIKTKTLSDEAGIKTISYRPETIDLKKHRIVEYNPPAISRKHSAMNPPCEVFDNPINTTPPGANFLEFIWNFMTLQEYSYASSKSHICDMTFRTRDRLEVVFSKSE